MHHPNRSPKLRWTPTLLSLYLLTGAIGGSLGAPNSSYAQSTPPLSAEQTTALAEATRLNEHAVQLYQQGKFSEAIPLAEQALAIRERILGKNHLDVATSLNNLAVLYDSRGRYSDTEPLLHRSLLILEQQLGKDHPDVATSLNNLAVLYWLQQRYSDAESSFRRSLSILKQQLGKDHPSVATSLNNLAVLYRTQNRYSDAEPLFQRSLSILEQQLGKDHPSVATSLNNLARLYNDRRRNGEAESLTQRSRAIRKQHWGGEFAAFEINPSAFLLLNQHLFLMSQGVPLAKQPLQSIPEQLKLIEAATGLGRQILELYAQGKYAEALALAERFLAANAKLPPTSDTFPVTIPALLRLAEMYHSAGQYSKAETIYKQVVATLGSMPLNPRYQDEALQGLGSLYLSTGRYNDAEATFKQLEQSSGTSNPSRTANILKVLSSLYRRTGRIEKAASALQKVQVIYEEEAKRGGGLAHVNLFNLASLYVEIGRYREAEPLMRRALIDSIKYLKTHTYQYDADQIKQIVRVIVEMRSQLAFLYEDTNRYSNAEPLLKLAVEEIEYHFGANHLYVADRLTALAFLYQKMGRYSEAESLLKRALTIEEQNLGTNSPDLAPTLDNLGTLYWAKGDRIQAIKFWSRSKDVEEYNLSLTLTAGSERQKQDYIATLSSSTNAILSLHLQEAPDDPGITRLALTTLLRRKGRILEALTDSLQRLRQNLTPADQKLLDNLASTRTQLATLYYSGLGNLTPEQYKNRIAQLQQQSTQLEADLNNRSATFRTENQSITLEAVQKQIPADAVLVELVSYQPFNPKAKPADRYGKSRYAAYILSPQGTIQAVDLGDAAAIDLQAEALRQAMGSLRSRDSRVKAIARKLDAVLMQPIRQKLGNTRNLLISPDSQLNLIPFAALVDEQNRYLVETTNISYLTSGRDLLRLQTPIASRQPPILMANPDYADPGDPASAQLIRNAGGVAITASISPTLPIAPSPNRAINQRSTDLATLRVEALPGTLAEANAIAPKLKGAIVLTGAQATENALKQVQAPCILHIATHGFFLEDAALATAASRASIRVDFSGTGSIAGIRPPVSGNTENALLRSGLALAGFNVRQSGSEDGVLTAQEAAGLDLRGTQLVVLSACETGIGNVANGEGVYGLRRAFVLAGAASQLTSLWQVSDAGTKDLMVQYYDRLLANQGRSDALRQTQLDFLHGANYTHPYYWAAFVPSGDWRPLK